MSVSPLPHVSIAPHGVAVDDSRKAVSQTDGSVFKVSVPDGKDSGASKAANQTLRDEFLTAFERQSQAVPPKPLANRDVRLPQKTGETALADLCKRYETETERIDSFLYIFGSALDQKLVRSLRDFSSLRNDMLVLGQKATDAETARKSLDAAWAKFCKDNPDALANLATFSRFCERIRQTGESKDGKLYGTSDADLRTVLKAGTNILATKDGPRFDVALGGKERMSLGIGELLNYCKEELEPAFDLKEIKGARVEPKVQVRPPAAPAGQSVMVGRAQTLPVKTNSAAFIGKILNNGSDGNCFFYSVADAIGKLPENTDSDRTAAEKMRRDLAVHIHAKINNLTKKEGPGLYRDQDGLLRVPHSFGNIGLDGKGVDDELLNESYGTTRAYIPTVQGAFLADMIGRPVVLLLDQQNKGAPVDSRMVCFNRNLETGERLQKEPLFIHYSGAPGRGGHFQAIEPNEACLAKFKELTADGVKDTVDNSLKR